MLDSMKIFLLEVFAMAKVSCAEPMPFFKAFTIKAVAFKVVMVLIVAVFALRARRSAGNRALSPHARTEAVAAARLTGAKTLFAFVSLVYAPMSAMVVRMFDCIDINGVWYLEADMRQQCFTPSWNSMAAYAAVMAALVTFGGPLFLFSVLYSQRKTLEVRVPVVYTLSSVLSRGWALTLSRVVCTDRTNERPFWRVLR